MNFYKITQNNSGGERHIDENLCHRLYIEAQSEEEALSIAVSLGVYFDGCESGIDCPCCGDRWNASAELLTFPYSIEKITDNYERISFTFNTIEEYAQFMADTDWFWSKPDGRIFFKQLPVKEIFKK